MSPLQHFVVLDQPRRMIAPRAMVESPLGWRRIVLIARAFSACESEGPDHGDYSQK
jgi:hypothetical protein